MKTKKVTVVLIIICVLGLSLLLYPAVSNYWNEKHATGAINAYVAEIENLDQKQFEQIWLNAITYNRDLLDRENPYALTKEFKKRYQQNLNIGGNGIMGYIDIAKLGISLPVYHGTSDSVLQDAVGHIEWTSLPTGGVNTHCVVSGHRGLPSAKLFTDLDQLREGDTFTLTVLDEVLTYEIDQIRTVDPDNITDLMIEDGKDYCTLVTCTPYGINTHRLLVRGHRIETALQGGRVISEGVLIDQRIVAGFLAVPILFALFMIVMLKKPEKKTNNKDLIKEDTE